MDIQVYIQSGIIESYVLGLADKEEAAELEKLRLVHPEIQQAITDFEKALETQASAHAMQPPAGLKARLFSELQLNETRIENEEGMAPVIPVNIFTNTYRTGFLKKLAVAAAVLLIGSFLLNIYYYRKYREVSKENAELIAAQSNQYVHKDIFETRTKELQNDINLLSDSSMLKVVLPGVAGKESNSAVVFWKKDTKDVYIAAAKLTPAPEGKQYQLWALLDGKPIDAGLISDCATVCKLKNIKAAQAFAITLEDKGGSPTPHLDQLVVMGKI